jgi:hypothetical protein
LVISYGKNSNLVISTDTKGSLSTFDLSDPIIPASSPLRSFFPNTAQRKYAKSAENVAPISVYKNHPTKPNNAPLINVINVPGNNTTGRIAYMSM